MARVWRKTLSLHFKAERGSCSCLLLPLCARFRRSVGLFNFAAELHVPWTIILATASDKSLHCAPGGIISVSQRERERHQSAINCANRKCVLQYFSFLCNFLAQFLSSREREKERKESTAAEAAVAKHNLSRVICIFTQF